MPKRSSFARDYRDLHGEDWPDDERAAERPEPEVLHAQEVHGVWAVSRPPPQRMGLAARVAGACALLYMMGVVLVFGAILVVLLGLFVQALLAPLFSA